MKITRWLIIAGIFLTISIAGLGVVYYQRSQQQKQLDARLVQAQADPAKAEIVKILDQKNDLESRIAQASLQLDNRRQVSTRQVVSSTITQKLFDVAKAHGMEITELVASVPTSTTLEGVSFSLINLHVSAAGDRSKMIDFLIHLNGSFDTGTIESVVINNPADPSAGKTIADIKMDIYTN